MPPGRQLFTSALPPGYPSGSPTNPNANTNVHNNRQVQAGSGIAGQPGNSTPGIRAAVHQHSLSNPAANQYLHYPNTSVSPQGLQPQPAPFHHAIYPLNATASVPTISPLQTQHVSPQGSFHHLHPSSISGQVPAPQINQYVGPAQGMVPPPSQVGPQGVPVLQPQIPNIVQSPTSPSMYPHHMNGQGQIIAAPQVASPVSSPPAPVVAPPRHPARPMSGTMPAKPSPPAKPSRFSFFGKSRSQVPSSSSYSFSRPQAQSPPAVNQSFNVGVQPPLPLRPQATGSSGSSSQFQSPSPPVQLSNPTPLLPLRPQATGASNSSGVSHHSSQGSTHSPSPGPPLPRRASSHGHSASLNGHVPQAIASTQAIYNQVPGANAGQFSYAQIAHLHDGLVQGHAPILSLGNLPIEGAHESSVNASHTQVMSSSGFTTPAPAQPAQDSAIPILPSQMAGAQVHSTNVPSPSSFAAPDPVLPSLPSESSVLGSPNLNAVSSPVPTNAVDSHVAEELLPAYHEVNSDEIRLEYHPPLDDVNPQLPTPHIDMPAAQSVVHIQELPTPHVDMPAAEVANPGEPVAELASQQSSPGAANDVKPTTATIPSANTATSSSAHAQDVSTAPTAVTSPSTISPSSHPPSVPSALSSVLGSIRPADYAQSLLHDASSSVLGSLQAQAAALGSASLHAAESALTPAYTSGSTTSALDHHPTYAEAAAATPAHHDTLHHTSGEHGFNSPLGHSNGPVFSHQHAGHTAAQFIPHGSNQVLHASHHAHPTLAQGPGAHQSPPSFDEHVHGHQNTGHPSLISSPSAPSQTQSGVSPTSQAPGTQTHPASTTWTPAHGGTSAGASPHSPPSSSGEIAQHAEHVVPVYTPASPNAPWASSSHPSHQHGSQLGLNDGASLPHHPVHSTPSATATHPSQSSANNLNGASWNTSPEGTGTAANYYTESSPAPTHASFAAQHQPASSSPGLPQMMGPAFERPPLNAGGQALYAGGVSPAPPTITPGASLSPHGITAQGYHTANPTTPQSWGGSNNTTHPGATSANASHGYSAPAHASPTQNCSPFSSNSSPSHSHQQSHFPSQEFVSSSPQSQSPAPTYSSTSPQSQLPSSSASTSPINGPVFEHSPLNPHGGNLPGASPLSWVQPGGHVSTSPPPGGQSPQLHHIANPSSPQAWNNPAGIAPSASGVNHGASSAYANQGYPVSAQAAQTQPNLTFTPTSPAAHSSSVSQPTHPSTQGTSPLSNPASSPSPTFSQNLSPQAFTPPLHQASSSGFSPNSQGPPTTSYQPVDFDSSPGVDPEVFYGSLLDPAGKPTQVLARFADAIFFFVDQNCPIPSLRGTQLIDPAKYAWFLLLTGAAEDDASAMRDYGLKMFLDMAGIPYKLMVLNGALTPVLDRRGYLHLVTFECRAIPDDSHRDANKYLAQFQLLDPATQTPFPSPVPRSAFPVVPNIPAQTIVIQWQAQVAAEYGKRKANAMMAAALGGTGAAAYGGGAAAGGTGAASVYAIAQQGTAAPSQTAQEANAASGGGSNWASAAQKIFQAYQDHQQNQAQQDQQAQFLQQMQQIQAQQAQATQQMYQQILAAQQQQTQMLGQQDQTYTDMMNQILAGNNAYLNSGTNGLQGPDILNQLQSASLPTFDPSQLQSPDFVDQLQQASLPNFDMSQLGATLPSVDVGDTMTSAVGSVVSGGLQALVANTDLGSVAGAIVPGLQVLAGAGKVVNGVSTFLGAFNSNDS